MTWTSPEWDDRHSRHEAVARQPDRGDLVRKYPELEDASEWADGWGVYQ